MYLKQQSRHPLMSGVLAALVAMAGATAVPAAHSAAAEDSTRTSAASHPTRAFWREVSGTPAAQKAGAQVSIRPTRFRATALDKTSIAALTADAPLERSQSARQSPLVISLPDPKGGYQRFTVTDSPVMEPGLAAKHPEIRTFAGQGIDDPTATIRMDISPLGFHASVRSSKGAWYIDPYYHLDDSLYVSYFARDLQNTRGKFVESTMIEPQLSLSRGSYHAADSVQVRGAGFTPGAMVTITVRNAQADLSARQTVYAVAGRDGSVSTSVTADPYRSLGSYSVTATDANASATTNYQVVSDGASTNAAVGNQLRTYRLALLTDPTYASYFGGSANVTAAKVALINRVTQVYESETAIRLVLIAGNDALNLDTAAQMTGTNGPCGGAACFSATQAGSCTSGTLTRNRIVVGLLAGASNFDIGHIALGNTGGGIAQLGVVGASAKAQGCTGVTSPVGDFFAVDYVAHEMGHQFSGNHTFNSSVCSANRNAGTSVEPGGGTSIMAYAGICGTDDLQPHSDPYWSQRSFDEITTYTSGAEVSLNEVQMGVLTAFTTNGQQFQLSYNGSLSAPIIRGTNFTAAGVKAAIEGISGWPSGGVVTITALGDTAFTITFSSGLASTNVALLQLVGCTGGCTGYVGEITQGGPTTRRGNVTALNNAAPLVTVPAAYTIPLRTPFALTGSATDADGDALTYMWEQNDIGSSAIALVSNAKTSGPLFRQFGTRAVVSTANSLLYNSPGENAATADPTRVFPDMAQILINNTNAETGSCTVAVTTAPTAAEVDCLSEFLPTSGYTPTVMNFKMTVRDGRGGVNSGSTVLTLAKAAGPFLVTSLNSAGTIDGTSTQTITWDVANTNVAPVSTDNVKITLSADGGATFPYVLAASTPNNGSKSVVIPNVASTAARVKVEAVGNVFFDVSNANLTIRMTGDVNGDSVVDCSDLAIVKASFGKRTGQAGFDARADVNNDGVVDIRDLSYVSQRVTSLTRCQ